jgi:hypothetical protein
VQMSDQADFTNDFYASPLAPIVYGLHTLFHLPYIFKKYSIDTNTNICFIDVDDDRDVT